MVLFISGALMMSFLTTAVFFASFWRRTRDPLFATFSLAFVLLAFERVLLLTTAYFEDEVRTYVYFIRLLAYILIIFAIIGKNRQSSK